MKFAVAAVALLGGLPALAQSATPPSYPLLLTLGSPDEAAMLRKMQGARVTNGVRAARPGQFWVYALPALPGAHCRLRLIMASAGTDAASHVVLSDKPDAQPPDGGKEKPEVAPPAPAGNNSPAVPSNTVMPNVSLLGPDNKPLPFRVEHPPDGSLLIVWTQTDKAAPGAKCLLTVSAKTGPVAIRGAEYVTQLDDRNGDGLPDAVRKTLMDGLPPGTVPTVKRSEQPFTVTQTHQTVRPELDLQTDAQFAYGSDADLINGWKQRGYTVWTMGSPRDGDDYRRAHPSDTQQDSGGKPITIDSVPYLTPTLARIAYETDGFQTALSNGSQGVCPEEPEYFARAGYEPAFRQAWQDFFRAPWQAPESSLEARYQAGRLMAELETRHVGGILQAIQNSRPDVRRMVALHSPLHYAAAGIVSPHARITGLSPVQDVIGQVWSGTARMPVRYGGVRRDLTFSTAYLEYSSLYQLLRGTDKRLWFLLDPLEDDPSQTAADYKTRWEQTLAAALLFPAVDAFEVMPWPERVYGHVTPEYASEINTVTAALNDLHWQPDANNPALNGDGLGVLLGDTAQWQRVAPNVSDLDGFYGLALPLLQRGVPVQVLSLDRVVDPGYLNQFRTLLLSYDFQKPLGPRTSQALSDWVKRGGSLLFAGGSDAYNALTNGWWQQAGLPAPQLDLFRQAGWNGNPTLTTQRSAPDDPARYQSLLKSPADAHDLQNRRAYTLDLTPYVKATGSVRVRFTDISPQDGNGPSLFSTELRVGGQIAASFSAGSELETRFLAQDSGSQFNGQARYADGGNGWTYQFDNLPGDRPITLALDLGGGFALSVASQRPDVGRTLLATRTGDLPGAQFPRLRVSEAYPITLYPTQRPNAPSLAAASSETIPDVLYNLRAGGAAVWAQKAGKGLLLNVGVAPGFFSSSERGASLLRALTRYAHQRAGGTYREPGVLRVRRGRYTIVRTFGEGASVDGRTIDLLSPALSVAEDRTIAPRSLAVLYDIGKLSDPPHVGFVSGRVGAKVETANATGLWVRGPLGTVGVARLHRGSKKLVGVRAWDTFGRPVSVGVQEEGGTVLLRWPHSPDGVTLRVGWR